MTAPRSVAHLVGRVLAAEGIDRVFGVVGSGNFDVTESLIEHGAIYVGARHEAGATVMADVYARSTAQVTAVSLHQGCGYTNAMTALGEAAKSHTPLLVITGETPESQRLSNFYVDQAAMATAVGAAVERVSSPGTAAQDAARAYRRAARERRPVVLNLPLDVQLMPAGEPQEPSSAGVVLPSTASTEALTCLLRVLEDAERPMFVGGRGARDASAVLRELADRCGAALVTSAVARGLFAGDRWYADTMGGFGTPLSQELLRSADVVVAWGASLNRWTTIDGDLLESARTVVQVDDVPTAVGLHHPVDLGIVGDVAMVAHAVLDAWSEPVRSGLRTPELAVRIAGEGSWRDLDHVDISGPDTIDPRTLTKALDPLLPEKRVVATDAGNFSGWPAMILSVPDAESYCLPLGFQCVGLGVAAGVGLALARPDRTVVVGVGDGGFLMGIAELETAVRLGLPIVYVIYDDEAYGAELHHFAGRGPGLATVTFPPTDFAAIARGYGAEAVTVRSVDDLAPVRSWVEGARDRPLVVHAKTTRVPAWMLVHAFAAESSSATAASVSDDELAHASGTTRP